MAVAQGARLLGEIEVGTLDELFRDLKALQHPNVAPGRLGIPGLDEVWERRGGQMYVCGRYRALLYHIVSAAVAAPRSGVALVVDVDGRFDVTRLSCSREELRHVYVVRPGKEGAERCMEEARRWLVYGQHGSKGRELGVRVVSGGEGGRGADVVGCWRGWMRVGRGEEGRVGGGVSVEEAVGERGERQRSAEGRGWRAESEFGEFRWVEE
ncbi:hypothetical protein VE03_00008 [Pseudogymnoascus sp. 23342-1-I1]|nr:hypothetical protein VE03_00008 [Pseudogymnoascus sp. 23342-1-I1]